MLGVSWRRKIAVSQLVPRMWFATRWCQRVPSSSRNRQAGKMLVSLLSVLGVIAMIAVGVLGYVLQQEREKRAAKERELQIALAENDDLKTRLDETQQAKSRVEEELGHVRKDLAQSKEQLVKAVEAQETLSRSVEDREREIGRLTKDLEQTRSESKRIATEVSDLQAERDTLNAKLVDLEKAKGELEAKLTDLSERPTVELEKVRVTSDQTGPAGTALPVSATSSQASEGQVVVVNREYDFIVMNLGKNHGLSVGQEFQILHGQEVLGKVKVEKVYDELSAAAILPESKKDSIREGDTVRPL